MFIERNPAVAVPNLRKAVELLPAQSRPRYLLGVAQENAKDYSAAAESLEGAYRLDPHNLEPILHLANLYMRLQRPADAEAKFRNILEVQPNNAQALLGVAQCLAAEKKPEAVDAYRSYLTVQPTDSAARGWLVHLLVEQQQYDAALAELNRAEAGEGTKPTAPTLDSLRMRADIQIAQKKWDDAIGTLNKAIALSPRDAQLHGRLGAHLPTKTGFSRCAERAEDGFAAGRGKSGVLEGSEYVLLSLRRLSRHAGIAGRNCKNGNAWRWAMVCSSALLR